MTTQLPSIALLLATAVSVCWADPAKEIVAVGMDRAGLPTATAIYKKVSNPDARVEFAYGLVLLKNYRRSEAVEHLQKCRGDESFLPGWEAALRVLADERKYDLILEDLPGLATAVSQLADPSEAEAMAVRLGQFIAAVELASENPAGEAAWLATLENLTSSLQPKFDEGYRTTESVAAAIKDRKEKRLSLRSERVKQRRLDERSNLKRTIEGAIERQGELNKTAADWSKFLAEKQKETGDKLAAYAGELDEIDRKQQARLASLSGLRLAALQLGEVLRSVNDPNDVRWASLQQLEIQIATRVLDIEDGESYRNEVLRDATAVRQTYEAYVARASQVLGEAGQRYESLNERGQAAANRLKKLQTAIEEDEQPKLDDKSPGWTPTFSVRELMPWDFSTEAARLNRG